MGDERTHRPAVRAGLVLMAVAGVVAVGWIAREVLLLAFLAMVLATVLALPVDRLARRMPRWLALLLVLLGLAGGVAGGAALAVPTLVDQAAQVRQQAPEAIQKARRWLDRAQASTGGGGSSSDGGGSAVENLPQTVTETAVPAVFAVTEGLTSAVLVGVLAVFLTASPRTYRHGIRRLLPDAWQGPFDESCHRVVTALGGWLRGILFEMLLNGVLAAVGLWLIGFHQWFVLAVITGLLAFVPYLGAIASGVLAMLVALSQGPTMVLSAGLVYLAIHMTEGYVITPMVMRRAVEVQPGLLLVGEGVMTALFGLMGTIVATPLIVCTQVLVEYLWIERRLGRSPREG